MQHVWTIGVCFRVCFCGATATTVPSMGARYSKNSGNNSWKCCFATNQPLSMRPTSVGTTGEARWWHFLSSLRPFPSTSTLPATIATLQSQLEQGVFPTWDTFSVEASGHASYAVLQGGLLQKVPVPVSAFAPRRVSREVIGSGRRPTIGSSS